MAMEYAEQRPAASAADRVAIDRRKLAHDHRDTAGEPEAMTTQQLYLFGALYFFVTIIVAVLTRATPRRIAGALAGGLATGVVMLGILALGERLGLWHMAITWEPYFLALMLIVVSFCGFIFLITWRIARRFGWRGLAVFLTILAIIGPPRDYWYMKHFPEWGSYAPGIAPVLAISVTYVVLVLAGHGVMRLVAGPAGEDRLTRRLWKAP
jgi:hypothetical protein